MINNGYAPIEPSSKQIAQISEDLPIVAETYERQEQEAQARDAVNTSSDYNKKTSVRGISKSIFIEMKRIFPQAKSNADLMEAVAYIFTSGKCEISPRAMELVKSYKSDNDIRLLSEQITYLTSAVRDLDERMSNNFKDRHNGSADQS